VHHCGPAVAQLVEALCCKPEGCRFNSLLLSLEFSFGLILPAALCSWGQLSLLTKMSVRNVSWGVRRADKLTTFLCWFSSNLTASTTWNPTGLSTHVQGLLLLFFTVCYCCEVYKMWMHCGVGLPIFTHITKTSPWILMKLGIEGCVLK